MKKNKDYICIYSRKSKYTGKGESIGNQIELCKEYISMNFGEDYLNRLMVYEDEGFSGGNLNRPDFKRMMGDARQRKFKAIVVYRLDRISRNISDFSSLIDELSALEVSFISIREQFDTGTPMGRAMMYIASVFSQLERETIAERIRDNMHELAKTGRWLGGVTPTGYISESVKNITIDGKNQKLCRLQLLDEEAELVKKIYSIYLACGSLTRTEAELLKADHKTKTGKDFTRFSIKAILRNPVYLIADQRAYDYFIEKNTEIFSPASKFDGKHGVIAYNRTEQKKGKNTVYLPEEQWILSIGEHQGLIPSKDWIDVQKLLDRNKEKSYRQPRKNEALLTGLIYCHCGERMYPKITKRKTNDGQCVFAYVCKKKEHSRKEKCNNKNVNGNLLDKMIVEQIKKLAYDQDTFIRQLELGKKMCMKENMQPQYEQRIKELQKKYSGNEKRVVNLVDSLADLENSIAKKPVIGRIETLQHENEELLKSIEELQCLAKDQSLTETGFEAFHHMLLSFGASIEKMSLEEKRRTIHSLVRKVIWDGEYAHLILFGVQDDEIEYPELPIYAESDVNGELKTYLGEDSKRNSNAIAQ